MGRCVLDDDSFLASCAISVGSGPNLEGSVQVSMMPVLSVENRGDVLGPPFIGLRRFLALGVAPEGEHFLS